VITFLIVLAISGLVIGALARLALPGPDPMGVFATILLGLAGSFVGGLAGLAIGRRAGFLLSLLGAILLLYLHRRFVQKRGLTAR
jgi:uncharacterized membrane protein YeaQ/YmgE (transglycosylase-associated protein family)